MITGSESRNSPVKHPAGKSAFSHVSYRPRVKRNWLALLAGSTALVSVSAAMPARAQSDPGTIISSDTDLTGNITGGGNGGFLVNGGTLTISNGTVSGFVTTGGAGSGGGAGLGGAIMVDTGGTVVLSNVTVQNNAVVGGEGGAGTVGGSLNNLFNSSEAAAGQAGATPIIIPVVDPAGQPGSAGLTGGTGSNQTGGTGGAGGAATSGNNANPLLIELVTIDAANAAASTAELVSDEAEEVDDEADETDDDAHIEADTAHVADDEAQAGATAQEDVDAAALDAAFAVETTDEGVEATGNTVGLAAEIGAEAEFTDAAAATASAIEDGVEAVDDALIAVEDGDQTAAETDIVAADSEQEAADDTVGGADAVEEDADSAKADEDVVKVVADGVKISADNVHQAADILAFQDDSTSLQLWNQALANGQLGIGGGGGDAGVGGAGDYGSGGGEGGVGGAGGAGATSNPAVEGPDPASYVGGAIGGNGGGGGEGGAGGFGAGGGSGGDGGDGGAGGGISPNQRGAGQQGSGGSGGAGGFGAGNGSAGSGFNTDSGGGGGGSGFGGAVFVNTDATLEIEGSDLFTNNSAQGGNSENGGAAGQSAGTDLFIMNGGNVVLAPGAGDVIVFDGTIGDNSVASIGANANGVVANGLGGGVTVDGDPTGIVEFNNINTYTGATTLQSGVLQAQDASNQESLNPSSNDQYSSNIDADSNITFEGGILQSYGTFTRYLGTNDTDLQWVNTGGNNGGGFSAIGNGLTVTLNGGAQLTWGQNNFVLGTGATLDFGSSSATANVTFTNAINLEGSDAHIAVTANTGDTDFAYMTGVLSNGSVTIGNASQTGVVVFTSANTYAGGTTIADGRLVLGSTGSLNAEGAVAVDANAYLDISGGGSKSIGSLSGLGTVYLGANTLTINVSGSPVFAGTIADGGLYGGTGGNVTIADPVDAETFTGVNVYTGETTINDGAQLNLAGAGSIALSSGVDDNGVFDISEAADGGSAIQTLSGSGTTNLGSNTLAFTNASTNFSGAINGTGNIDVMAGHQSLSGDNGFTGMALVDSGATLALTGGGSIADASALDVAGTFDISAANGGEHLISLDGGGDVALGANSLTLTAAGGDFSGSIGGSGGLTLQGGSEELTGNNSYTGATLIDPDTALMIEGSGGIADSSDVTDNGLFDISLADGGVPITTLNGAGTAYLGANTLTLTSASGLFSGEIQGAGGGLDIAAGSETLTGANNYSGATTVASGATLALSGNGTVADSSGVADDGNFDISAVTGDDISSVQTLSGSGTVNLGANTLAFTNASTDFSGDIEGAGNIHLESGTQTLSGANGFTGNVTVDAAGVLALSGGGSIADAANAIVDGTLDISNVANGGTEIQDLTGGGGVALGANTLTLTAASENFYGALYGTGGFTIGAGTEELTGPNTYTGATTTDGGATLDLSDYGTIADSSEVDDNGIFDISGNFAPSVAITSLAGNGAVALGGNTLEITDASTDFAGDIAGSGGLQLDSGTQTLSGANVYSGLTSIGLGATLAISGAGSIANSDEVTDNGTLDISGSTNGGASITTLDGSGGVALGGNTLTLTDADGTFAGGIGNTGNLIVAAGAETLTGSSNYTGTTTIDPGAALTIADSGSLNGTAALQDYGTVNVSGGAAIDAGSVDVAEDASLSLSAAASLVATNGVTDEGGITLSDSATISGGTISVAQGGSLTLTDDASVAGAHEVDVAGYFDISGENPPGTTIQNLNGNGSINVGANILDIVDETGSFTGDLSGTGSIDILNGALVLPSNPDAVYQGTLGVNQSTVTLDQASENDLGGPLSLDDGTVDTSTPVVIDQPIQVAGDSTLNGPANGGSPDISGDNSTTVTGAISGDGTLDTTGNIIDDGTGGPGGGTDIVSGVLLVGDSNNPNAVLDGDVTLGSVDSTLRGHGTVDGNVSGDGNVYPGGSIGTLTITGNYTQPENGTLTIEVTPSTAVAGTDYDQLVVGGTASLAGTLATVFNPAAANTVGDVYANVVEAGSVTGQFSQVTGNQIIDNYMEVLPSYTPTQVNLVVTATPLAYDSGKAVLDAEYIQTEQQIGTLDAILNSTPQRAAASGGSGPGNTAWGQQSGGTGHANGDSISAYNTLVGNGIAVTPNLTLGVAYSFLSTNTQSSQERVQGKSNAFYAYGAYEFGNLQISAAGGGGEVNLDANRHLDSVGMAASGSKGQSFYEGGVQARYYATVGNAYVVPFLRMDLLSMSRGAFSDNGAGPLNISYNAYHGNVTAISGGIRAGYYGHATNFDYQPWMEVSATGFAGNTKFTGIETIGTISSTLKSTNSPGGLGDLGAGITFVKNRWSGTLSYDGQFAGNAQFNTFDAKITYNW